jgi:murein DD-endopeptidase MepM/ murein hydrolase activator NlpD
VQDGVRPGATVQPGQVLGRVGNTGYGPPGHHDEFPPHLHFGIEQGSEWVNPYPTLVELYGAAVAADSRTQRALDALARGGNRSAWVRLASRSFTTFRG